jgi:hypothetical protein
MKKIALYISVAVLCTLAACQGKDWDTDEELMNLTDNWSYGFVDYTLQKIVEKDYDGKVIITTVIKDTICREFHHISDFEEGDSVNVVTTLYQFGDSTIVTVDGYRYTNKYFAHLFTIDPGIVNYEGIFHVDFYETDKTTPWAWGEITYKRINKTGLAPAYTSGSTKVGRY